MTRCRDPALINYRVTFAICLHPPSSLRMTLSGVSRRRFPHVIVLHCLLPSRATGSHNSWTTTKISSHTNHDQSCHPFRHDSYQIKRGRIPGDLMSTTTGQTLQLAKFEVRQNHTIKPPESHTAWTPRRELSPRSETGAHLIGF